MTTQTIAGEQVLEVAVSNGQPLPGTHFQAEMVQRAADPNVSPPYALPGDYTAQYPVPVPTKEVLTMCDEIGFWNWLPDHPTALKSETWREMNALYFTSGSQYIAFGDGLCPEEYAHSGNNFSVSLKNIGAKKTLGISDIIESTAIAAAGLGINQLGGPYTGPNLPGEAGLSSLRETVVIGLKAKEIALGSALVLNGWNRLLVQGNASSRPLEFDGIENWAANRSLTFHTNDTTVTGTFSAQAFDRWLSEGCATPDVLLGHPSAMQEVLSSYFVLGFQGSQIINVSSGQGIVPGFNFAGFINTGVGRLPVVADKTFARTTVGSTFRSNIWALRSKFQGYDLAYKITQIPLSLNDLVPGCTTIAFQLWAKTAFVLQQACAQSVYTSWFTGRIITTCPLIGQNP